MSHPRMPSLTNSHLDFQIMTESKRDRYKAELEAVWPSVRRAFNYPLVRRARLSDEITETGDAYRWQDDEVVLSKPFLDCVDGSDDDRQTTIETLLKHEVGHYVLFPRELVHHLRYLQRAVETFGDEYGSRYYSLYADICVDLRLIGGGYVGTELLELRERALDIATAKARSDVEETVQRRVHRLLLGIYQETFDDLPRRALLTDVEQSWLEPFLGIDYFVDDPDAHERNVIRFGNALEQVLDDIPGRDIQTIDSMLDEGKSAATRPFGGDDPATIRDAELDDALSDAVNAGRSYQYERLLDFLESQADFQDPLDPTSGDRNGAAGIEPGTFERHDEVISFYRRWAQTLPLSVTATDVPSDAVARYRRGRRSFESSDPIRNVDPFASFGILGVPGITKVDTYAEGEDRTVRRTVPDLLVGLDSSASMPHPTEDSHAILAAFLLAATYRRAGARVGGYNFSTELAYLPPTTDRSVFQSLACGYWGGGTTFDRASLADFVANADTLDSLTFSTSDAYERLLERMEEDTTGSEAGPPVFGDKQSFDHVLVTDGNLVNRESLVDAIRDTPAHVRTFLFVTDSDRATEWESSSLGAWVYAIPDVNALAHRVLGLARERLPID